MSQELRSACEQESEAAPARPMMGQERSAGRTSVNSDTGAAIRANSQCPYSASAQAHDGQQARRHGKRQAMDEAEAGKPDGEAVADRSGAGHGHGRLSLSPPWSWRCRGVSGP